MLSLPPEHFQGTVRALREKGAFDLAWRPWHSWPEWPAHGDEAHSYVPAILGMQGGFRQPVVDPAYLAIKGPLPNVAAALADLVSLKYHESNFSSS